MRCEQKVRLYVISHKDLAVPPPKELLLIRSDHNEGNNIADKVDYCELRAQYWVWKNTAFAGEDYIGFFQYRRYLDVSRPVYRCDSHDKRPVPYRNRIRPHQGSYSREKIEKAVTGFDAVAPVLEYTGISVWQRFCQKHAQGAQDLKLAYQVIRQNYPDFCQAADQYLNGQGEYYGNIFIMRRTLYDEYCAWLFDILSRVDRRSQSNYPRVEGYLGERLFGIYFTWLKQREGIRCGECPRVHFSCYDGPGIHTFGMRAADLILPPGSKRRSNIRAWAYRKHIS